MTQKMLPIIKAPTKTSKKVVGGPKTTPLAPSMGDKATKGKKYKKVVGGPKSSPSMLKKVK
jgi:hypothetical protein